MFLSNLLNMKHDLIHVYLPPDANSVLACLEQCFTSKNVRTHGGNSVYCAEMFGSSDGRTGAQLDRVHEGPHAVVVRFPPSFRLFAVCLELSDMYTALRSMKRACT